MLPSLSPTITKARPRALLANLALSAASIAFTLLICEVALRLLGFLPMYVSPERDRFWQYDPLLGWAHRPGQSGVFETGQFRTFVRINQSGLRDREHTLERPDERQRLLVLGDSFAWGYGVEEAERFSQQLEAALDIEVINAGVSGYSTDQELLWYQQAGVHYEVDLVLLVLTGNDLGDNERDLVHAIYYKPRFVFDSGRLALTGTPVPQTSARGRAVYFTAQRSSLANFLVQRYFDLSGMYWRWRQPTASAPAGEPGAAEAPFGLTQALLAELKRGVEAEGAEFMIVATEHWWNAAANGGYQDFLDTLRAAGFLVLDVEAEPGFNPGQMLIPDDGHWNSAGHAFVAGVIQNAIDERQLLNAGQAPASPH